MDDTHILGVKIQGNIIAMEQCDLFANLSKYDMILQDRVTDSYNSNYCYRCDIKIVDSSKEFFEINGWKLNYISFGGNWYGQWGVCNIEDRYGKKYKIDGCSQQWYYQHFISMLTTCLYNFMSFAKTNICVDYIKLSETISNIDKLGDYLRLYKEFENNIIHDQTLLSDEKLVLLSKMKSVVIDNVITCLDKK